MAQLQGYGSLAPPETRPRSRTPLAPAPLSRAAGRLFKRALLYRQLMRLRPYVCPFHEFIRHVPPGSAVLDVGCGGGLFLGLLHEAGVLRETPGDETSSTGFDRSRAAIRIAREMARESGPPRLRFVQLDIAEPWPTGPDGGFDVVSIIDLMHHVSDKARFRLIESAFQRLRPGGRLIYKDMIHRTWRSTANRLHDLVLSRQFVHYTPATTVEQWARGLGFRMLHTQTFNRLWYCHELMVFEKPEPAAPPPQPATLPITIRVGRATVTQ